jgi:ribosome biogenesis GTPase / thiamine phosphate phosphatase
MPQTESGRVIHAQSGFFTVESGSERVICQLRGKLKRGRATGDLAALGDIVQFSRSGDGSGMIESVETRTRALVRLDPRPNGVYQQVLLANPDQILFVFACANPTPRLRMLDRFLVIAEKQHIPALIVANKVDLVGLEEAQARFGHYPALGYPVLYTSTLTGAGLGELAAALRGKTSGLAGPSGVGKSSLLNALQPGLGLAVREISSAVNKGRHTTTARTLHALEGGGYLADTPGIRALALWDTEPEELDGYFPELRDLVAGCQYNDCTHQSQEPGCAIHAAVQSGNIHPERYESYLRLRAGQE